MMTDQKQDNQNSTIEAENTVAESDSVPAYILARIDVPSAQEEEREEHSQSGLAAFTAAAGYQDVEDDDMPGLKAAGTTIAGLDAKNDAFEPDLKGAGWITCRDGTKLRDDGVSIYMPDKTLSPGQAEMIIQLAMKKGWTEIYPFHKNSNSLHMEAAAMLSQLIAVRHAPLNCCTNPRKVGRFSSLVEQSKQAIASTQYNDYQREQSASDKAPTPCL